MVRLSLLVCSLAACGRFGFPELDDRPADGAIADTVADSPDGGAVPSALHRYTFAGDLSDKTGGAALTALLPGTFEAGGYRFPANGGLSLDAAAIPQRTYTIDMEFSFDEVTSWRKVLDFDGGVLDRGLYVYSGALEMVLIANPGNGDFLTSAAMFSPGVLYRLTVTRDASDRFTAYLNKTPIAALRSIVEAVPTNTPGFFEFDDLGRATTINASTLCWFVDDTATSQSEAAGGVVRQITVWNVALTPQQVAAL